jgi:hypothetical protein
MTTNLLVWTACLILEAGGEGTIGMQGVNEVIVERARSSKTTEAAVCLRRKQFSCFNGITWQQAVAKAQRHPKWDEAVRIVRSPVTKHAQGANHYCTVSTFPYWAKGRTPIAVIRNHKFYRL